MLFVVHGRTLLEMGAAAVMLQQSLQTGRNAPNIQLKTIKKFRSALLNACLSSAEGQQAMVMAKGTQKLSIIKCPTYSEFFERFVRGLHTRMGGMKEQDLLKEIYVILEEDWLSGYHYHLALASKRGLFCHIILLCSPR
jgi:hypothetical protein